MSLGLSKSRLFSLFPPNVRALALRGLSSGQPEDEYDVVVVGGGHNGLVAAAYLAKLGVKTAVFERRHLVGGAAVTEEIVPNYKFSRASYVLSLLRPKIFTDLELKKHGLKVHLRDPSSYTPIRPDLQKPGCATSLTLGMCGKMNYEQIAQFSEKDAKKYAEYEEELEKFVKAVDPLLDHAAVDVQALSEASIFEKIKILKSNLHLLKSGKVLGPIAGAFYELMTAPTTKILNKWFESEPLKATLATDSCIGAMISPDTPGSGYVLLHHVMGELEGIRGAWGYPEGGMGAVSGAIAKSAQASGAQIFTSSPVSRITTASSGEANGLVLEDGTEVRGKIVLSNATPEITFNRLMKASVDVPEDFRRSLSTIDYTSPVCKINVAVNKIPNFLATPNTTPDSIMPHHRCTIHMNCENSSMIEEAYQDAKVGNFSRNPMIEMTIPSSLDHTLAPKGHHVCLIFTQYAPYTLNRGEWDDAAKEDYAANVLNSIEMYAPGFKESIVGKEVLPPPELERIFGLTGGNIFHGSMSLDQLYMTRPTAGHSVSPATPVANLLLCGSGAHPGGGVMGAPGRIAAQKTIEILGAKWKF
eukprot:GFUD01036819.1.p1 GENE.GFUD01036819.1~~GFUD01036819.1.p1  ORF type:complete len:586 (+),score=126.61 GFUD01036819.1:107-1864(+)